MIKIRPYVAVIAALTVFVSPILGTVAAVQITSRSEAKVEESRRLSDCGLFGRLLDAYAETPPSTPAGRNVQEAYREYYNVTLRCVPPR